MPASRAVRARATIRAACVLGAAGVLLSACAASGSASEPTWQPKPSFSGEGFNPTQSQPAQGEQPSGGGSSSSSSAANGTTADPAVVATKLNAPVGLTILPDNTALVGERTTGRIVRVQSTAGKPVQTVRTITGLSTAGGGGLLDLAISPTYSQDNLIFAYLTTPTDNRVVDFTLTGPITPVLTGIPRGNSDNAGRLAFAADGSLLVGTGDAGHPTLAADPTSLAGKVLRISDIGAPAAGNPNPRSPVYATGFRQTAGLCIDPDTGTTFQTEALTGAASDPINHVIAGGSYGWPQPTAGAQPPLAALPAASRTPGGCTVLDHVVYTTSLDGHALLAAAIKGGGTSAVQLGAFSASLHNTYGRLRTVVAAADGALWLTTSNRDGHGKPVADDERVVRIVPTGGGTNSDTR